LHFVRGLIELPAQLLHLRIATFARETLKLTRGAPGLFNQLLLLALVSAAAAAIARLTLLLPPLLF
jgi:hypothetical protein